MRIRIGDPALVGDLSDFLRRAECIVERAGARELVVRLPRAFDEAQGRRELGVYVATWQARHPGVAVEIER